MTDHMRDEFLSEEDLDLASLSDDELLAYWDLWLLQAQASNDDDEHRYSHGVFEEVPLAARVPLAPTPLESARKADRTDQ